MLATRLKPNSDKCSDDIARIGIRFAFKSLATKTWKRAEARKNLTCARATLSPTCAFHIALAVTQCIFWYPWSCNLLNTLCASGRSRCGTVLILRSLAQPSLHFVTETLTRRYFIESVRRNLDKGPFTEILPRDLLWRPCEEILYRDLWQRSCVEIEISDRDVVQRSCTEISYKDLVRRRCMDTSDRSLAKRSLAGIWPRDLLWRVCAEILPRYLF